MYMYDSLMLLTKIGYIQDCVFLRSVIFIFQGKLTVLKITIALIGFYSSISDPNPFALDPKLKM